MNEKQDQILKMLHAIVADKWGYIWGTAGMIWTAGHQEQIELKYKDNPDYQMSIKYGSKWIGHHVADCSGLVCHVWKMVYDVAIPHGSNSQWKLCKESGNITSLNMPVGTWVFKSKDGKDFYHIGIYIGNGVVIEAKGARYGVVQSDLSTWQYYGIPPQLNQVDQVPDAPRDPVELPRDMVIDTSGKGKLNIRKAPSGVVLDRIPEGATVKVLEDENGWAKVEYIKTITGYVMDKYLK